MAVVNRSAINPHRDIKWERMHVLLCILAVLIGAAVTAYWAREFAPVGAVLTVEGKNSDLNVSSLAFFLVALALSLVGLIVDRRRVIYRMAVGSIKPDRYEELNYGYSVGYLFHLALPGVATPLIIIALVLLYENYEHWPYGWAVVAVSGLMVGYLAGQSTWALWAWMVRRSTEEAEQPLDVTVKALLLAASLLFMSLKVNEYSIRSVRRIVRRELFSAASMVKSNHSSLAFTFRSERALRREVKVAHARIAQAIREHARKLATAQTEEQCRDVASSLLGGLRAALQGDIDALLENAPELTRSSKIRDAIRWITPALVMMIFAVVIPLLPGVGDAAGSVRIILLATAALTLIPGASSARPTIEGALSKALPGSQKP